MTVTSPTSSGDVVGWEHGIKGMFVSPARSFVLSNSFTTLLLVHCYSHFIVISFVHSPSFCFGTLAVGGSVRRRYCFCRFVEANQYFDVVYVWKLRNFAHILFSQNVPSDSLNSSEKHSGNQPTTTFKTPRFWSYVHRQGLSIWRFPVQSTIPGL